MNARRGLAVVGLLLLAGALVGCEKPLLAQEDERSPFDRYDMIRNQFSEQYVMDPFGRRKPNLRERLLPKD